MSFLTKIFGTKNDRYLKKLEHRKRAIKSYESRMHEAEDEYFPKRMAELREMVCRGEATLDDLLPEVFAMVREAAGRTLNLWLYDVQMLGGIVLHEGRIAEMKTGEGKTLVATLAASLNALAGRGVHVVTVNDYLARRDAEWMGKVYSFLGLTTGVILHGLTDDERQLAYAADITYGTNNEFGFDYLRDNMKFYQKDLVQRGHNYAIVDEVDSILIDEARTPLIISGASDEDVQLYRDIDDVVCKLDPEDYNIDEKARTTTLTEVGVTHCEQLTGLDNLFDPANTLVQHHILQSLKAHHIFKKDVDYIVHRGEVVIVDEFTGRTMPGRRYSDGLHQALEAKEHVKVQAENQTLASITYQNFFRLYDKLAGMTGTADTEAVEFKEIYNLEVISIPTNEPMIRKDYPDLIFQTTGEKFNAIIEEIKELYKKGQPVLVGTISIETSEMLSKRLKAVGIPHSVLNAKHHAKEAEIVAQAGQKRHVTIATNMAGRGTDIVLGEGVRELGGLHILGTERHESRRIDNQLRGRSGRQGDPGSSRFYLSLEDTLMRLFGSDRIKGIMDKLGLKNGEAIENAMVSRAVENAQKKVEAHHFEIRKTLLDYDNVMNQQREVIYALRREIMESDMDELFKILWEFRDDVLDEIYDELEEAEGGSRADAEKHVRAELDKLCNFKRVLPADAELPDKEQAKEIFVDVVEDIAQDIRQHYNNAAQTAQLEDDEAFEDSYTEYSVSMFVSFVMLDTLDRCWKEHLRAMDALRDGIGLRGYGQRDPKLEYKREGYAMFQSLLMTIRRDTLRILTNSYVKGVNVSPTKEAPQLDSQKVQMLNMKHESNLDNVTLSGGIAEEQVSQPVHHKEPRTGRNALCPCGSGKKYKKCCGRNA